MICFGFTAPSGGLSVELCEEVILYRTFKREGIRLVANIIVKSLSSQPKKLGIWHRAGVGPFSISETANWLDEGDVYSYLFFHLAQGRGRAEPDESRISAKLFSQSDLGEPKLRDQITSNIIVPNDNLEIHHPIEEKVSRIDPSMVPYTYAEVGPFSGRDQYYAIRVTAMINDVSFDRLVIENPLLGTRYYQIYGTVEILDRIRRLDMARLKRRCGSESILKEYEKQLKKGLELNPLKPAFYSIVAVDSPDTRRFDPDRLYTIHVQKALKEFEVDTGVFKHPKLKSLKDRVFWFVNKLGRQDFLLWLEGPMGETQSPNPKDIMLVRAFQAATSCLWRNSSVKV